MADESPVAPLEERLDRAVLGAFDAMGVYLGARLGLYRALQDGGAASPAELAERAGVQERYAREWLEQQAVSGVLRVAQPSDDGAGRRYELVPEDADVLLDPGSERYRADTAQGLFRALRGVPGLVRAFREGGGLTDEDMVGADPRRAEQNRPTFMGSMAGWLAQVPGLDERLRADPQARVADVACGSGWSSIAIALAYPKVRVDGFDIDPQVIALAKEHVAREGLEERVAFEVRDAADPKLAGRYDLVTVFEALHDMAYPVAALRSLRALLHEGGVVLVVDELTEETFTVPGSELERSLYGWSLLSCLPWAMAEPGAAGTGTVMRPATLRAYAEEAGFRDVEVLGIENEFWRFYLLVP